MSPFSLTIKANLEDDQVAWPDLSNQHSTIHTFVVFILSEHSLVDIFGTDNICGTDNKVAIGTNVQSITPSNFMLSSVLRLVVLAAIRISNQDALSFTLALIPQGGDLDT